MRWQSLFLSCGLAANVTEPLEATGLLARESPETTNLPAKGIATTIGPGETHYYRTKFDQFGVMEHLSLSECQRHPKDASPLRLATRRFNESTYLGLADISYDENDGTIEVQAPKNGTTWSYQLGVGYSSSWPLGTPDLYLVDSDFQNALFVTAPYYLVEQTITNTSYAAIDQYSASEMNTTLFSLFVFDKSNNPVRHLNRSYCALEQNALLNQNNADLSETTRGKGNSSLRGQFFLTGLNHSTAYEAYLGLKSLFNGALGGATFRQVDFRSKTSSSCQILYNMTFCNEMAFAVPGNATSFSVPELSALYDSMAMNRYKNFSKSLQQVSCNVSLDNRFSMFADCDTCDYSYRQWLCATTIPRCADWTNNASYLAPRDIGGSRNPEINRLIQPGRYKEILPCRSLCYSLVRDCPTDFGFNCPGKSLIDYSYGEMADDGDVTCSYPGAVYDGDGTSFLKPSLKLTLLCIVLLYIL